MRVRDLEIALVLAREMKAAAARSVDASLRVEQLQEVFGATQLDQAERTRMQTALQMAGLEPRPSLLEADLGAAIHFGLGAEAPPLPEEQPAPEAEPAVEESEEPQEFPTVGEFARSTFERARRRFGGDDAPPAVNGTNGAAYATTAEAAALDEQEHLATDPDHPAGPAFPEDGAEPLEAPPSFGGPPPDGGGSGDPLDFEEPGMLGEHEVAPLHEPEDEPQPEDEAGLDLDALGEDVPAEEELDAPPAAEEPIEPHVEHELPVEEPEAFAEPHPDPHFDAHDEAPPPAYEPEAQPLAHAATSARLEELAAALLPAVAIPVLVTSLAGWRFGLPFVALSVIATGLLLRRSGHGPLGALRHSEGARSILKVTVLLAVTSGVLAVLLASAGHDKAPVSQKRPAASKPAPPAKPKRPAAARHAAPAVGAPATRARPHRARRPKPADNGTSGLIRVPPRRAGTGTTGSGTGTGTGTAPQGTTGTPGATGPQGATHP